MEAIKDLVKSINSLKEDLIFTELVNENTTFILALQTNEQLYDQGVRSDGSELTPKYTDLTVYLKLFVAPSEGRDSRVDHVTLKDTGDLYSNFFLRTGTGYFEIDNDDSKKAELIDKYGDFIGLTDESIQKIIEEFKNVLPNKIRKRLNIL